MSVQPRLRLITGPRNFGALQVGDRTLLLGCAPPETLQRAGVRPETVEWVLITHHHRAAAEGAASLAGMGARIAVPEAERALFENAETFWRDDSRRIHAYSYHPSRLSALRSIPVARGLREYETFEWRGLAIVAMSAPGPTAGGMAFLVNIGGKLTAFTGELICGSGRLRDFHSLQGSRSFPGGRLMEYHGFGERAADVLGSLDRILGHEPDVMVPTSGALVRNPRRAVEALRRRIAACRSSYHAISAGRWYFPQAWPDLPDITLELRRRCRPAPEWVVEMGGTSRVLRGDHGAGLLIDCAGDAPDRVRDLKRTGKVSRVDHLWITHYHDDHVDRANAFRASERCSLIAHESVADLLRRPEAYLMPCLDPRPIEPDRITRDGESWQWGGLRLTAFTMPGQTLFDAALLVERGAERALFVGDSFTPGGLDDYCTQNRNLLGVGLGHDRALALLERLGPDVLLINEHVEGAFVFSRAEVRSMRAELARRVRLFRELLDWDDPNFGLDPQWVRSDPYYSRVRRGSAAELGVVIRNHSPVPRTYRVALRTPEGWEASVPAAEVRLRAREEGRVTLAARAPEPGAPARAVVGIAIELDGKDLGELAEALVDVT